MFRLLADENVPGGAIRALRDAGCDVRSVAIDHRGVSDLVVLAVARTEARWLVTFDRDHGDLIFNARAAPPPGILYLRFVPDSARSVAQRILEALRALPESGVFAVVGDDGAIRQLRLPADGHT